MSSSSTLEGQVQALTDFYNSVQTLRHIPQVLVKTPNTSNALPLPSPSFAIQFQQVKDITQIVRSEAVQTALRSAQESAKNDSMNISNNFRRENRKRRRPPSPESPQPYTATESQSSSLFPPTKDDVAPLKHQELIDYIRHFNKEHSCKIQIWQATRSTHKDLRNPVVLRFSIKDVLTAYLTVSYTSDDLVLVVESVTAFGPRERKTLTSIAQKLPHSQSEYSVYRILSQQFGRMIHSDPQVGLQRFVDLLCSYENMFTMRCAKCERVLCADGHIPAVERIWKENWISQHVNCGRG